MRIAFSSCMSTRVFADQPVWDWIRAQQPDHLVLLGDSIYLDIDSNPRPQNMGDVEFAQHLFDLYTELIAQPQFAALVGALPAGAVHAIWDDHDFLWNDVNGAEMAPLNSSKVLLSTAFLEAFRGALQAQFAAGSFPAGPLLAPFWNPQQPPLTAPSIALAPDLWLHLSDGRSNRTRVSFIAEKKRELLGAGQRAAFFAAIEAAPQALHLFASGSTVAGYQRYAKDLAWLKDLASRQRMLVLSGDIHRNDLDAWYTGQFPLHEATSSGAAIKDAVIVGEARRNFGLLDIDADTVTIRLYADNAVEQQRVLDRQTWLPV